MGEIGGEGKNDESIANLWRVEGRAGGRRRPGGGMGLNEREGVEGRQTYTAKKKYLYLVLL